jgi:hypothetical protein
MVNRPHRDEKTGMYTIAGKQYHMLIGSRHQVMNGTAYKTKGELTKGDLMMNKWGRIVSRKKHLTAKKEKRLQKFGYFAKKGKFGFVKKEGTRRKTRRGGYDKQQQKEQQQQEQQQEFGGYDKQQQQQQQQSQY